MATATFPTFARKIIRGSVNPLDKSTIVSIYHKELNEVKHTLFPGRWKIPAGSYDKPSLVVIGPSSWFRDFDDKSPVLEIPVSAIQVAESIVKDYCNTVLEASPGERVPGIFFIPGEITLDDLKKNYKVRLDLANRLQRNWYERLVRLADSLWARTNGNSFSISDDMRYAAQELGLVEKPWIKDFQSVALVKCVACGNLRDPGYPICQSCKAIVDPDKAKLLNLTFAK